MTFRRPAHPFIAVAISAFSLATLLDIATTLWLRPSVKSTEGDPIMAWAFARYGHLSIIVPGVLVLSISLLVLRFSLARRLTLVVLAVTAALWLGAAFHTVTGVSNYVSVTSFVSAPSFAKAVPAVPPTCVCK